MSSQSSQSLQRSRWTFTLNNYDKNVNYKNHFRQNQFKVSRAVWGYEIGSNGIEHLQGYLELQRSLRLSHVAKILPMAHWEGAREDSLVNYRYCVKDGHFDLIGDFSFEQNGTTKAISKRNPPLSVGSVVNALLNPETSLQIMLSKEYAEKHWYFDKIKNQLAMVQQQHRLFDRYKEKKLFHWQYQCLKLIKEQGDREVLWIVDGEGNSGKTFLGQYLGAVYGFMTIDGTITTRDLAYLIKGKEKGFCFDVSRDSLKQFCYSSLEAVKNGHIVSGKYGGKLCLFDPLPTVIFANDFPDLSKLSLDRWAVHTIGHGVLSDRSKDAIIDPSPKFPFVLPTPMPNLSENFDFQDFLKKTDLTTETPSLSSHDPSQSPMFPAIRSVYHTSQVAGPSTAFPFDSLPPAVQDDEPRHPVCPLHGDGN